MNRLTLFVLAASLSAFGCGSSSAPTQSTAPTTPVAPDEARPDRATPDDADDSGQGDAYRRYGEFVTYELVSAQPAVAREFYGKLLSWEFVDQGGGVFAIRNRDRRIGTVRAHTGGDVVKPGWVGWLSVADVADVVRDVVANRGKVLRDTYSSADADRAIVAGTTGGSFGLIHKHRAESDDDLVARIGDFYWNQLWSSNQPEAVRFYSVVGDYQTTLWKFGSIRYRALTSNRRTHAVVVPVPAGQTSRWVPFVRVADPAAVQKRAVALGATVVTKTRVVPGIGAVAVVKTPSGGFVGFIAPPADD